MDVKTDTEYNVVTFGKRNTYSSSFRQIPYVGDSAASVYVHDLPVFMYMICFATNNNEGEKQQQTTEHK